MDGTVTVSGFTVIQVKLRENKNSAELNWWLKETSSHSISVIGIPLYASEECVRRVFSSCGNMESVSLLPAGESKEQTHLPLSRQTIGYQQASIKFKKMAGAKKALAMKYNDCYTLYSAEEKVKTVAREVWTEDLQASYKQDTEDLLTKCTKYMQDYDKKKAAEEKKNRKLADEPDEDGWITVTRNKFSRPPKAIKAHELKKVKKKKQAAALLHFYKNQVNDSKMQRIKELKAKFEEDKKKIQEMRQQRKFKPY